MAVGKIKRPALPFSNVVATGVATNQITQGRTIEHMALNLGGTSFTKSMITDIKVKANGKVIFNTSGNQLDKMMAFRGEAQDAAFLVIPFADNRGNNEADRMVGALDTTLGINSLTSEVTISGASGPTLVMDTLESAPQKDTTGSPLVVAGLLSKVLRYPFSVATGGQLSIPLPFGPNNGARIKRMHIEHTGNCTALLMKQDGNVIHETTKAKNEYEQKRRGLVPQTNWYSVDFVDDGNFLKWLDTRDARSLEILPTFSAADSGYVIVEYVDPLGNL